MREYQKQSGQVLQGCDQRQKKVTTLGLGYQGALGFEDTVRLGAMS